MKERGMIFNTEMVKAILEGRKTQTRRRKNLEWLSEIPFTNGLDRKPYLRDGKWCIDLQTKVDESDVIFLKSPFGIPGDRIYVRETFTWLDCPCYSDICSHSGWIYKANNVDYGEIKWRPSIHMPRKAARLFLEITDVRVERVRDISEEDAIAEGIKNLGFTDGNPHKALYAQLYESIYGPDSWEKDWVWVYKFKVL